MSLEQEIDALRRVPIIGLLDQDALRLVAFSGERRGFEVGEVLQQAGTPSQGGAVVLDGSFGLERPEAAATATLAGPGSLIGELALIIDTPCAATATALERSEVLLVPRRLFRRVLVEYPRNAAVVHRALAERLAEMSAALSGVAARLLAADAGAAGPGA